MIIVYVTYPNKEEAKRVSEMLVQERLVACANILSGHESLYWWQGKVQNETEVAVLYKSRNENFDALEARIKALHSYDVPCIISWPIEQGHGPFLKWIEEQTGG